MPDASAAADPPEEPPALLPRFQGLRVTPNTELNVWAPANSGTLDFAIGMAPFASSVATVMSVVFAIASAKIGEP